MNLTSSEIFDNLSNIANCISPEELNVARMNFAHCFIVYLIPCFYCIFTFISEYKLFYWNFSRLMEFMRSVLAGFIISMFLNDQYKEMFHPDTNKNAGVILLSNLPILLLSSTCLLMFLGIGLRRLSRKRSTGYNSISTDARTISPNIIENRSTSVIKTIKKLVKTEIEDFNIRYAPKFYLSIIFVHAFFSGLGSFENQNIGWHEMIICIHKIFEIFRIKQAFDTLNLSRGKSFYFILVFAFITPLGFAARLLLKMYSIKVGGMMITELCEKIFAQSYLLVSYVENFIPFPETRFDVVITWPICLLSYVYFSCYLKNSLPEI